MPEDADQDILEPLVCFSWFDMPEDADQDILEPLVSFSRQQGPTEASSPAKVDRSRVRAWAGKIRFFLAELSPKKNPRSLRVFLGQLPVALKWPGV